MTNPTVTPPGSEFEQLIREQLDFANPMTPTGYWRKDRAATAILAAHRREIIRVLEG